MVNFDQKIAQCLQSAKNMESNGHALGAKLESIMAKIWQARKEGKQGKVISLREAYINAR